MIATERLKVLGEQIMAQRASEAEKAAGEINSENSEKIAPAKRLHRKKPDAKRGRGKGTTSAKSNVTIAKQFGIDETTVRRDSKRSEALGTDMVARIAKLPAFSKGPT
jgi:hypothetical protein